VWLSRLGSLTVEKFAENRRFGRFSANFSTVNVRGGSFDGLGVPQLAAALSSLLFESRRDGARRPSRVVEGSLRGLRRVVVEVRGVERECGVAPSRPLDAGFADAAYDWAGGASLAEVLGSCDVTAGDFVRAVRQVIDLAHQLVVAPGTSRVVAATARGVVDAMRRDIIELDALDAD